MLHSSEKRQISIAVDAQLLDEIDKLAGEALGDSESGRSRVFEEALRLWRSQKIAAQLTEFYQGRSQTDVEAEEDWAEATEQGAIAAWDGESL
jgi:hypothetical protein